MNSLCDAEGNIQPMLFRAQQQFYIKALLCDAEGNTQPMLFRAQQQFYIKALLVSDVSCFVDAADLLFKSFFAFNVDNPNGLHCFYGFIERLYGLKELMKSSKLNEMWQVISAKVAS